jgi:hypothetical protein
MPQIYPMLVPDDRRVECAARRFGLGFLHVEPAIYAWAGRLAPSYSGGYWNYLCLSNGGWYMAPSTDEAFEVTAANGFSGSMSADALGIAACLYAFSHGSFGAQPDVAEACGAHFHQLRDYALQHPASDVLLAAID